MKTIINFGISHLDLFVGVVLGGIFSWFFTYWYYIKSSKEIPEWAKLFVTKLPSERPSKEKLLELFQEALNSKEITPDPILGNVACPDCKSPISEIESKVMGNDDHTIIVKTCPHCGWSNQSEL